MKLQSKAIINGKYVHRLAWLRAKRYNAIPKWSRLTKNRIKILHFYIEAQNRNINSKGKYEVDHIIPLYHPKVCGLHVKENLQVLNKLQNQDKSNEFHCYREINGRKYYYTRPTGSKKERKIPKKHNQTKKNPMKMAKKIVKNKRNKVANVRRKVSIFKVKS